MGDCLGGISVGAYLERILVLDLEKVGNLGKNSRNRQVFHEVQIFTTEDTEENREERKYEK